MLCWCDCVDDDQLSAATRAWQREETDRFHCVTGVVVVVLLGCAHSEQLPDPGDVSGTVSISEEAIVTDAVLALWQNVDQEPADELICVQRHGGVATRAFKTVIFDAEGNTARIETDQSAVGYCNAVGVSRQIGQHGFGPGEGFFGVNDPVDLAQGFEKCVEGILVNEARMLTEEVQFPSIMQLGQAFENEPPVKARQHTHGQEEVLAASDPL